MVSSTHGRILLGVLAIALVAALIAGFASKLPVAKAQTAPGIGAPVPPPSGDVPPPPAINPRLRPMMMGRSAAVTAAGTYVYVVADGMLYQFRADDLKLVKSAELPLPPGMEPMRSPSPPLPGAGPGAPPAAR